MSLPESVDVLIVGAGHVGLAMSSFLTEARREHLVVERRDRLGGAWQDRWEEFALVTPNWTTSFPGWAYDGADPDGFMSRAEVTARVARYAEVVGAPVALGTTVQRLTPAGHRGFRITTNRGQLNRSRSRGGNRELPYASHSATGEAHLRPGHSDPFT